MMSDEQMEHVKLLSHVGSWISVTCAHVAAACDPSIDEARGYERSRELQLRIFAKARAATEPGRREPMRDSLKRLIRATLAECLAELDR